MTAILTEIDIDTELGLHSRWQARAGGPDGALAWRDIPPPPCNAQVTWESDPGRPRRMWITFAEVSQDGRVVSHSPIDPPKVRLRWFDTLNLVWQLTIAV